MSITTKRNIEAGPIRQAARGHWLEILMSLCPEIELAIVKPGRHTACPVHGGQDGFRLFPDANTTGGGYCNSCGPANDGFKLLQWLKGWAFPEALIAVNDVLGGVVPNPSPAIALPASKPKPVNDTQVRERLRQTWAWSYDWRNPAARTLRDYVVNRGIDLCVLEATKGSIRFHPGLRYFDEDRKYVGTFPALLALICDAAGKPVTIHRIYLSTDGRKAPVDEPKKMMSIPSGRKVLGGAIHLGDPVGDILDIAEGVETALAVRQAINKPVWSAVNATLLSGFTPPHGVRKIKVWCDLDPLNPRTGKRAGEQAALNLQERLAIDGIGVELLIPPERLLGGNKKLDWLDVLNAEGVAPFLLGGGHAG